MQLRRDTGAAAVETALVLPLLLGVAAVVVLLACALATSALVSRGAAVAARAVALPAAPYADDAARYRTAEEIVAAAERGAWLLQLPPGAVQVQPESPGEGQPFAVTVQYRWRVPGGGLVRLVTGGLSPDGSGTVTFIGRATGVRE